MPRPKPLRPGDDCPVCGSMLYPHCAHVPWPGHCGLVKCRECGGFGDNRRWAAGVPDEQLDDES